MSLATPRVHLSTLYPALPAHSAPSLTLHLPHCPFTAAALILVSPSVSHHSLLPQSPSAPLSLVSYPFLLSQTAHSSWDLPTSILPSYPGHTTTSWIQSFSHQCFDIIPKDIMGQIPGTQVHSPWVLGIELWVRGTSKKKKNSINVTHSPSPVSMSTSVSSQPSLSLHTMLLIRSHFQLRRVTALNSEDVAS